MEDRPEAQDVHICPYLGAWWDWEAVCRYASGDNRCYAFGTRRKFLGLRIGERKPYRYVSKEFQTRVCLTGKCEKCNTHRKRVTQDAQEGPKDRPSEES